MVRPVGRVTQTLPDGTIVLELIKPPNGPFGFVISRGKGRPDTGNVWFNLIFQLKLLFNINSNDLNRPASRLSVFSRCIRWESWWRPCGGPPWSWRWDSTGERGDCGWAEFGPGDEAHDPRNHGHPEDPARSTQPALNGRTRTAHGRFFWKQRQ